LGIRLAYGYGLSYDAAAVAALERRLTAARLPLESREASLKIGARFVKTVAQLGLPLTGSLYADYTARVPRLHHCTAYALLAAAVGAPPEPALKAFLYAQVSALTTNCVKLVPLSQSAGQRILAALSPVMTAAVERSAGLGAEDFARSAPGFDIRGMQHEELYSRLYMS
jgi:urease accessory protein